MSSSANTMQGVMPPPKGVTPDFSGERTDLQRQVLVVYSAMTALSAIILAIRIYTRAFINNGLGLDDYLVILSWMGCVAWFVVCIDAFKYGFGEHMWNITPDQLLGYLRTLIGICVLYVWTPALSKFSLLVLYHRISPAKTIRTCVYILAALVFGYSLSITIVVTGPCNPVSHPDPSCLKDINLFMAIINILTDFFIMMIPLPMIHQLQLPRKQKVALGIIFALGSGVIITSMVRIIYVYNYVDNPDTTFYQATACIFSEVELTAGVICTSMVLLKPFVKRHMPCLLSFSSQGQSNNTPSGTRSFGWFSKKKGVGRSYELQSNEEGETWDTSHTNGAIAVTKSYDVHVVGRDVRGDGESTEEIMAPDRSWGVK